MSLVGRTVGTTLESAAATRKRAGRGRVHIATEPRTLRQVSFLGFRIDDITLDEAASLARDAMSRRHRLQHGDLNVAKFIACRNDHVLLRSTMESDLVCADGMGV